LALPGNDSHTVDGIGWQCILKWHIFQTCYCRRKC